MTAAPTRSGLRGALLALIALLTVFGASTWHSANFHDDPPASARSLDHDDDHDIGVHDHLAKDHGAKDHGDGDSAIHLTAHIVGHGLDLPAAAVTSLADVGVAAAWPGASILPATGLDPASLLRPPQA